MKWDVAIQLIIAAGLSVASEIAKRKAVNDTVTDADWAALEALAKRDAQNRMAEALVRHNVAPDSPEGKAFLELVK